MEERSFEKGRNLEGILNKYSDWKSKISNEVINYFIDTSAKVGAYALPMAVMEASRGLDLNQIIQSRTSVALVDAVVARVYGRTLDYARKKLNPHEKGGVRGYLVDTLTMMGIYAPVYSGILCSAGANEEQIISATGMLCGILALTARPFGKYILNPWRRYWRGKIKKIKNSRG